MEEVNYLATLALPFQFYAYITVMRALLQYLDADFNNPASQFIHKITILPIRILRRVTPRIRNSDLLSPFVLAFLVTFCDRYLYVMAAGVETKVNAIAILALARILDIAIILMIGAIIVRVILSWISRRPSPLAFLIISFTEPVIRPVRNRLPVWGGLDFSPIIVFFLLQAADTFVVGLLQSIGYQLLR